jgi:hypothetical protein
MLKNPFLIYILTFGSALALYQLGWSEIYPETSSDLLAFFGLSFVVSASLALVAEKEIEETRTYVSGQMPWYAVLIVVACLAADIAYTGSIPLLELYRGELKYGSFVGIPSLHVFAVTFGSAFSTIRFADFLFATRWRDRLRYFIEASIPIGYFLLVVYRGPALIVAVSWAFVFVIRRGRIGILAGVAIAALTLGILHFNGILGEARSGLIDDLGKPTQAFRESGVPHTYFWTYLYATAPIANLQYAVDVAEPLYKLSRLPEFFVGEMLPDFISNRILPLMKTERLAIPEISAGFNVSSIFGRSYLFFGWIGVLAMFAWFMALILVYLALILRSPYRLPCLALLNTLIVFCVFENMIAYTALLMQLVWPLLLGFLPQSRTYDPVPSV